MRLCKPCWAKLRAAIDERGLSRFLSPTGLEAAERLLTGRFDPLIDAMVLICRNSIEMFEDPLGDECPLCEKTRLGPETGDDWIMLAADEQAHRAAELGLLGPAN